MRVSSRPFSALWLRLCRFVGRTSPEGMLSRAETLEEPSWFADQRVRPSVSW